MGLGRRRTSTPRSTSSTRPVFTVFGVWCLGFFGFGVLGSGFWGFGFRVWCWGFWVLGFGSIERVSKPNHDMTVTDISDQVCLRSLR